MSFRQKPEITIGSYIQIEPRGAGEPIGWVKVTSRGVSSVYVDGHTRPISINRAHGCRHGFKEGDLVVALEEYGNLNKDWVYRVHRANDLTIRVLGNSVRGDGYGKQRFRPYSAVGGDANLPHHPAAVGVSVQAARSLASVPVQSVLPVVPLVGGDMGSTPTPTLREAILARAITLAPAASASDLVALSSLIYLCNEKE